jgi:two-component system, NarL family, nitrate/nitrite response regulator NarL
MFLELSLVLVVDDPLARGGLVALLPDEVEVVRAVGTDVDVAMVVAREGAQAVLWDAVDGVPSVRRLDVGVPVVVLVRDEAAGAEALGAGARGVLLRDGGGEVLAAALVGVRAGLKVVDERLGDLVRGVVPLGEGPTEALTPREVEVLELLAEGRSNREIGTALEISSHTAKFHVDRLLGKLDASGRTDAVVRAVRLGLLRL